MQIETMLTITLICNDIFFNNALSSFVAIHVNVYIVLSRRKLILRSPQHYKQCLSCDVTR